MVRPLEITWSKCPSRLWERKSTFGEWNGYRLSYHRPGGFNKHLFLTILEVQVHSADSSGFRESWVPGFQMPLCPPAVESREEELALASSYKGTNPIMRFHP